MAENIFNKTNPGKSTLVGNWQEEVALREFTGQARTKPKEHIPKKHGDLENPIIHGKQFDNTADRIYGERRDDILKTNNHDYGKASNPADSLPKIGRRTEQLQKQIHQEVAEELRLKQEQEERKRQERYFDSTTKTTFVSQDLTQNTVGRRVMKTQNGGGIPASNKDEQLQVEHGFGKRLQTQNDNELYAQIPKGDYTQTIPVTTYTEGLKTKQFMMSAATGPNPFAKTSGMTQPLNQTRAVNAYEGNIDFQKESNQQDLRKTNLDLSKNNPYNTVRNPQIENFEEIKQRVISLCAKRSSSGIRGLRIMFKAMDRNRNGSLDPVEFKYAMRDYGVEITEKECAAIVKYFDTNQDGKISFDEFLRAVRGDLNENRRRMVHMAYGVLDKDGSGQVNLDDIRIAYDVSCHPDFIGGIKTRDEVLLEFMQVWEKHKADGIVTIEEFEDYYKDISASIDRDDYFELMIRNAWHIAGGEGQTANTTIKRVLKTNPDGSQEVVMVENDLDNRETGVKGFGRVDI